MTSIPERGLMVHGIGAGIRKEKLHLLSITSIKTGIHYLIELDLAGDDSTSQRDSVGHWSKEASKSDPRGLDGQKYTKEEKKKDDDWESSRHKDRYDREPGEQFEGKAVFTSENQDSAAKKPKLFSLGIDYGKDADERQSSSSKQAQELVGKVTSELAPAKSSEAANDIDAAMKAAELESGHNWDTALFSDCERQEKFNILMGVKGDPKVEHKPDNQESSGLLQAEKQRELQLVLEKQYTAGLRRRDGRTVGLGL